ncbi:MAG TPA: IS1380 family transposase, partial [Desulfobacteraceae bacterium]|nr:IS1380 family transposase [Desulfobacteraceae bacterium]
MHTECNSQRVLFQGLCTKKITADFKGGSITSDAGGLLLAEIERARGFIKQFSRCFADHRDPGRIDHSVGELLGQRIMAIALGYEDLNDHDRLRSDP